MAKMVRVQVLAEQFTYSYPNPNGDGTHVRAEYVRGQALEMPEDMALQAAEGAECKEVYEIVKNSSGSFVFSNPAKPVGVPRAAVRILAVKEREVVPVADPVVVTTVVPARALKPAGTEVA